MKFENTQVFNFEGAFRGMRNPLESWEKSDSSFEGKDSATRYQIANLWLYNENNVRAYPIKPGSDDWYELEDKYLKWLKNNNDILLGPNDLGLAQRLLRAGNEHAKFMRQIFVSVDITGPLYWWKEADTYKVGTTANSTSTMHKLMNKPFTRDMFSYDETDPTLILKQGKSIDGTWEYIFEDFIEDNLDVLNTLREKYLETKDKRYWRALVQLLPNAFNQTRTWTANYAILRNMYFQRRDHKLIEWHDFCDWIVSLPYAKELIMLEEQNETY